MSYYQKGCPAVQFHVRLRDDPATPEKRAESREDHWRYFEEHADHFIARGATRTDDGETFLSSVIFVDFEDWDTVRAFVANEPHNRNGVYKDVSIRRWGNALGRLQRDFARRDDLVPWYIRGHGKPGMHEKRQSLLAAHTEYFRPYDTAHFITRGAVWDDAGEEWRGSANLICLESRAAVEDFLAGEPYYRNGLYESVEIERYLFGGRPGQVT